MIPEITEAELASRVLAAPHPVLVEFTTAWCGPCRALQPILEQLQAASGGRYEIVKVDGDASPSLAARCGVRGFPTLVLFEGGVEVARQTGLTTARRIRSLLERAA